MKRRNFIRKGLLATAGAFAPDWSKRIANEEKPTVLVYAFTPYADSVNLSQMTIDKLAASGFEPENVNIVTETFLITPDYFRNVNAPLDDFMSLRKDFKKAVTKHKPDIIIGMGEHHDQYPSTPDIKIETQGYNFSKIFKKHRSVSDKVNLSPHHSEL